MSRIGRMAVVIPPTVKIEINGTQVNVKGPKGELSHVFPESVKITQEGNALHVTRASDNLFDRSMHGTARALLSNMVTGVSTGFERILEINGVGYRAEMDGNILVLHVGYSHPVRFPPPEGISFATDAKTRQVKVMGRDIQKVGQITANIREIRPPEPYLGKGIKYLEEKIRRKAGKTGKGK